LAQKIKEKGFKVTGSMLLPMVKNQQAKKPHSIAKNPSIWAM